MLSSNVEDPPRLQGSSCSRKPCVGVPSAGRTDSPGLCVTLSSPICFLQAPSWHASASGLPSSSPPEVPAQSIAPDSLYLPSPPTAASSQHKQVTTAPSGRRAEPNGVSLLISLGFNLKKKRTAGDQVILPGLHQQPSPPAAVLINGCASCRASVIGVSKVFTQSFTPNCHEGQNNRASPMQVKYLSRTSTFQAAS